MSDEALPTTVAPVATSNTRNLLGSTVGTVLEWYDFNLYGLGSALVFGPLFFGSTSVGATLASFATFAVGFAARPIGGMVLGNLGDRIGRKRVLMITFVTMGIASALIGCLPTAATVGALAPVLLIALRVIQGFAVGGEFAGATLITMEAAPPHRRGLFGAIPSMGTGAGSVLANLIFATVVLLPHDQFLAWGWRLPFLFSVVLVAFGLVVRIGMRETPIFRELEQKGEVSRSPLLTTLRDQPLAVLRTIGITVSGFVWAYLIQSFGISYATNTLHIAPGVTLWAYTSASALEILAIPFWGWLSDKVGRKRQIITGLVLTCLYAYPFFWLLGTRNPVLVFVSILIAVPVVKDIVFGPQAALVAEMFDSRVRYSGVSAGRELGGAIFGGTAPFIGTALVAAAGGFWPVALYVIAGCLVTMGATAAGRNNADRDLRAVARIDNPHA